MFLQINNLQDIFFNIFDKLGLPKNFGQINLSQRPEYSDYQINGAMAGAKLLKQSPLIIAGRILELIPKESFQDFEFENTNGFINIKLKDHLLLQAINVAEKVPEVKEKVIIDFSGPNVAKSMHVGHLRSTLIGASLVNLYRYQGSEVYGDNHLGDFGTPLGIVVTEIMKQHDFSWTLEDIERLYVIGSKEYKENELFKDTVQKHTTEIQLKQGQAFELWKKVIDVTKESLNKDYSQLDIVFDLWHGESSFQERIPVLMHQLENDGFLKESFGAKVLELEQGNPLILQKQSGAYLYQTTDLVCLQERLKNYDRILYVVDNRQQLHFEQLFAAIKKLNWQDQQIVEHIKFGTINGEDNKPFKTRDGGILKLSDLIQQMTILASRYTEDMEDAKVIGIGGLKFAELKHNRISDYVFSLDKFISKEGFTGPYIMYSVVRGKSILTKNADESKLGERINSNFERELILAICQFSHYFKKSIDLNEPHHLCEYAFLLANKFNNFYQNHSVLKESDLQLKFHRLALVEKTISMLTLVLNLLGIKVPSKM